MVFRHRATHHITPDLANMNIASKYNGSDSVQVGNGQQLGISHGNSFLDSGNRKFCVKDILFCSQASCNLLSVRKFSRDNHCYFKFDDLGFSIKEKRSDRSLYNGQIEGGMYSIKLHSPVAAVVSGSKQQKTLLAHQVISTDVWHKRLGHPSSRIQSTILSCLSVDNKAKDSLCTACELGKSHKLPFISSTSITTQPLQLLHSDVWGPAS